MSEEFYIGYLPRMPKGVARAVKIFVVSIVSVAIGLAILLWFAQKPFAPSVFEFGTVREFKGTIHARPIPFLLIEKNDRNIGGLPAFERIPLVSTGKHGFAAQTLDGQKVRLKGTLIYRDDLRMIEVAENSIEKTGENPESTEETAQSLGNFTLRGEIVDSKCYLGVMNPGAAKPHRDCAVACLRGGIPPLFIVKDTTGNVSELWLLSANGENINTQILDYVAEPLEITGELARRGDQLFMKIDPSRIKRLP